MDFLVGTHSFLLRVELDEQWRLRNLAVLDTDNHYGSALLGGGRVLVAKRSGGKLDPPVFGVHGGEPLSFQAGAVADVHQLAAGNGGVYVADTGHNRVLFVPLCGGAAREYRIGDGTGDVNHVNSVYPCGPQLFALLHNLGRDDGELLVLREAGDGSFAPEGRLKLWHRGIHNVFVDGARLYYNASRDGRLIAVDLRSEQVAARSPRLSGHNKGLAVVRDVLVVGVSDHAPGHLRPMARGRLAVLDRATLRLRAMVDLEVGSRPVGNVNEVRCLSEPDLGHAGPGPFELPWATMRLSSGDRVHHWRKRLLVWPRRARRRLAEIVQSR